MTRPRVEAVVIAVTAGECSISVASLYVKVVILADNSRLIFTSMDLHTRGGWLADLHVLIHFFPVWIRYVQRRLCLLSRRQDLLLHLHLVILLPLRMLQD